MFEFLKFLLSDLVYMVGFVVLMIIFFNGVTNIILACRTPTTTQVVSTKDENSEVEIDDCVTS